MVKRKTIRFIVATAFIVVIGWLILTLYVEKRGPARSWKLGAGEEKALIIFDPDPFYNLDEQVCKSFARALVERGLEVDVVTVAAADSIDHNRYKLIVYCANTYNWQPDWAITGYIDDHRASSSGKPVVAVTLGAGSTEEAQRDFEKRIRAAGGNIIGSYSLWLWRPNDEEKMDEPNVEIAVNMAYQWGKEVRNTVK